MDNGTESHIYL